MIGLRAWVRRWWSAQKDLDTEASSGVPLALADRPSAGERVVIFADNLAATQEISFIAPLSRRRNAGTAALAVVREVDLEDFTYATIRPALEHLWALWRPTIVILSRIATRHIGAIVAQARTAGTPILAHLDDNLFAVPEDLGPGKAARHNDPARLARLTLMCVRAQAIYVSTPGLASALQKQFPEARILSGDIYAAADEPLIDFRPRAPITFGYMGTAGHANDLADIAEGISSVLASHPDTRFETFGTIRPPSSLSRFGGRVVAHPRADDYQSFLGKLGELGWSAGLAPLRDTPFNACKADTKFVEYAKAGIPAIVADLPVYRRAIMAGAALAANASPSSWTDALERLLPSPDLGADLVARAHGLVRETYSMSRLEAQLLNVIGQVAEKNAPPAGLKRSAA